MPRKSIFGDVIFNGSRFVFWALGPWALLFSFVMTFIAVGKFQSGQYFSGGLAVLTALVAVCFFLVLLNGKYFWWAGRIVTLSIFIAYTSYFVEMWVFPPIPANNAAAPKEPTLFEATLGLLIIGWPCLCYTFLGRFTLSKRLFSSQPRIGNNEDKNSEYDNNENIDHT